MNTTLDEAGRQVMTFYDPLDARDGYTVTIKNGHGEVIAHESFPPGIIIQLSIKVRSP